MAVLRNQRPVTQTDLLKINKIVEMTILSLINWQMAKT